MLQRSTTIMLQIIGIANPINSSLEPSGSINSVLAKSVDNVVGKMSANDFKSDGMPSLGQMIPDKTKIGNTIAIPERTSA